MKHRIPLIKSVMTAFPFAVRASASLSEAQKMMEEHNIRHLPVIQKGNLVGVLSEKDLRSARDPHTGKLASDRTVADLYDGDALVVDLGERLDTVLEKMETRRTGSALVVKEGRLAGIFTTMDVCRFLRRLLREFFPQDGSHTA